MSEGRVRELENPIRLSGAQTEALDAFGEVTITGYREFESGENPLVIETAGQESVVNWDGSVG